MSTYFRIFTLNFRAFLNVPSPSANWLLWDQGTLIFIRNTILIHTTLQKRGHHPSKTECGKQVWQWGWQTHSPGYKGNVVGNIIVVVDSQLLQGSTIMPKGWILWWYVKKWWELFLLSKQTFLFLVLESISNIFPMLKWGYPNWGLTRGNPVAERRTTHQKEVCRGWHLSTERNTNSFTKVAD